MVTSEFSCSLSRKQSMSQVSGSTYVVHTPLLLCSWLASSRGSKYLNWQPAHSGWKLDSPFDHTLKKASI